MSQRLYPPADQDQVLDSSLKRGLAVVCPLCGMAGQVYLSCADTSRFCCRHCEEFFGISKVQEYLDQAHLWAQILAWAKVAPTRVPAPGGEMGGPQPHQEERGADWPDWPD